VNLPDAAAWAGSRAGDRRVGVFGAPMGASVDRTGAMVVDREAWTLDWWIGADDRWHLPGEEVAVRASLLDGMPVALTDMRVPGGDARQQIYGAHGDADALVIGIENDSPAPFVVALVVRGASSIALEEDRLYVDDRCTIQLPRSPSRHAVATDVAELRRLVESGAAVEGPLPGIRDRAARLHAALLFPVPHRARLRVASSLGRELAGPGRLEVLPDADAVVRGWHAQLERGTRVSLPDEALQREVQAARAAVLLGAGDWNPDGHVMAALEDWGFDQEAAAAWARATFGQRRVARRRARTASTWEELGDLGGAALLLALRSVLVHEGRNGRLDLLPAPWPSRWRGGAAEVHGLVTRQGPVSFALRWHGERPALLWEAPSGVHLRVPGLDPTWSSEEASGEALLGARSGDA
jgi:hypothetical protein